MRHRTDAGGAPGERRLSHRRRRAPAAGARPPSGRCRRCPRDRDHPRDQPHLRAAAQVGRFVDWHWKAGARPPADRRGGRRRPQRTAGRATPTPEVFIDYRAMLRMQERLGEAPLWQRERALGLLSFAVRTRDEPATTRRRSSHESSASTDPSAGIDAILPLERLVASSVARPRFHAVLLAVFAGVAAAARRDRDLRGAGVHRRATDTGDWRAHGARRAASPGARARAAARAGVDAGRTDARHAPRPSAPRASSRACSSASRQSTARPTPACCCSSSSSRCWRPTCRPAAPRVSIRWSP